MKNLLKICFSILLTLGFLGGSPAVQAQDEPAVEKGVVESCPTLTENPCRTTGLFSRGRDFQLLQVELLEACREAQTIAASIAHANEYAGTEAYTKYDTKEAGFGAPWYSAELEQYDQKRDRLANSFTTCNKTKYRKEIADFETFSNSFATIIRDDAIRFQQNVGSSSDHDFRRLFYGINTAIADLYSDGLDVEKAESIKYAIFGFANPDDIYNPDISAIPSSKTLFMSGDGKLSGTQTKLRDYTGGAKTGREQFRVVVEKFKDFVKTVMVPIALFIIVFMGAELFLGGRSGAEEQVEKKKKQFFNLLNGFVVFAFAIVIVDFMVFGNEGEIFRNSYFVNPETGKYEYVLNTEASLRLAGQTFSEMEGVYDYLATVWVIISVLFLTVSAFRLILSGGSEEAHSKAKKHVLYSMMSLAIVISARPVLRMFTGSNNRFGEAVPTGTSVIEFFAKWADYLLGFVGVLAVTTLIYAGVRMVIHFGDEEGVSKAKKLAQYAIIGLILAFSTWTIINFFANPSGTGVQTGF